MVWENVRRWATTIVLAAATLAGAQGTATARDLVVGQIGPLGGPKPIPAAIQLGEGMKAAFTAVNRRGGVNGSQVDFFQLDDNNDTEQFMQRFQEAQKKQPAALLSLYGSPTIQRVIESRLLDQTETVVINAIPGADAFRKPGNPKLFHVRAGDRAQIERILQHVSTLGLTRMAVLYVDAPGGHSGLATARDLAVRLPNLQVQGFQATYEATDSMSQATKALSSSNAQSALIIGPPKFLTDAVQSLRNNGFRQSIFSLSYLQADDLFRAVGPMARGVGIAQTYPNPMGVTLGLQREFQAAMRALYPERKVFTPFQLEGYVCARIFIEAAKRVRNPTPDDLANALQTMGEIDLGGFRVNFSQGTVGSRFVDIGIVNDVGHLVF